MLLLSAALMFPLAPTASADEDEDTTTTGSESTDSNGTAGRSTSAKAAATMSASGEDAAVGDGLTESTAAASCWEIKQNDPSSASGVYWLVTPELEAPGQFYCDQQTDGGGWVLIGRGRENWTQSNSGRRTADDVAQTPTGQSAFSPAQLSVDTVNGLLNGGDVDELDDSVRLRRATNTAGTAWQEVRFTYSTNRDGWSWQFAGLQAIGTWSIAGSSGRGGTTGSFGTGSAQSRVDTGAAASPTVHRLVGILIRAPSSTPPRPPPATRSPSRRCSCVRDYCPRTSSRRSRMPGLMNRRISPQRRATR
jgi:hypothetical protein